MKKKCILCLFGVIPRSIKYTYKSINDRIIEPLKKDYDVDIYIFNLNVDKTKVDGVILNQNDIDILPYKYKEEYNQEKLDTDIKELKKNINFKFRNNYAKKFPNRIQNAIRQMYSEYRVGSFLEKKCNNYDVSVVCGPDYYIANQINLDHVKKSIINNFVFFSQVNNAQGITNGFYFGKPKLLYPFLKRYEIMKKFFPNNKDYEYVLLMAVKHYKINIRYTNIVFFKIRASKNVWWQGGKKLNYIKNPNHKKIIRNRYNSLKKNGFKLI